MGGGGKAGAVADGDQQRSGGPDPNSRWAQDRHARRRPRGSRGLGHRPPHSAPNSRRTRSSPRPAGYPPRSSPCLHSGHQPTQGPDHLRTRRPARRAAQAHPSCPDHTMRCTAGPNHKVRRAPHDGLSATLHRSADQAPPSRSQATRRRNPSVGTTGSTRAPRAARRGTHHRSTDPGQLVPPREFRSEAAFASFAGVTPISASSGLTNKHRLNRSGDRQLNRAFHTITLSRM